MLACLVLVSVAAAAQGFGGVSGPAPAQPTTLPLSGRAPQAGSVHSTQNAAPGAGVNTLNPAVTASGAFSGSVPGQRPFNGRLSLADAIARGLAYNLGYGQWSNTVRQSQGQSTIARSALLPNLNASFSDTSEQTDLKATGLHFTLPTSGPLAGFSIPTIVGPFNYMSLQASLSQVLFNRTALDNYHASQQTVRANQLENKDARDLVTLAVGGAYLGVIAAQARLKAAQAELTTAQAVLQQSRERKSVGSAPQLTVNQNSVQAAIQKLQITTLSNNLAKRKIELARMIGLPPDNNYTLSDTVVYAPAPPLTEAQAVQRALQQRADLQAAAAQAEAARFAAGAARDQRLPSASVSANYGVIGSTLWNSSHGVYTVTGTINLPLWQGGRISGSRTAAEAVLAQRQAELADTRSQIEAEVRDAYLDLNAASSEVQVARDNLNVARQTVQMTRDRFDAGVINTVELIQAQQQLATAQQDYINSVYAHSVAKLTLARAMGEAATDWPQFLKATPVTAPSSAPAPPAGR